MTNCLSATAIAASNTVDSELISHFADSKVYAQNDGLHFWIVNKLKYPLLSPLAHDLLSAPASEAYVERVFLVCEELTAGKRNRLTNGLEMRTLITVTETVTEKS